MTNPIEMQDVTEPPKMQAVYAIALRKGNEEWWTTGVMSSTDVAANFAYWRGLGYEARLLTAQMPVETKP